MPIFMIPYDKDPRHVVVTAPPPLPAPPIDDFPSLDGAMITLGFKQGSLPPILRLPLEIREMIWEAVAESTSTVWMRSAIQDIVSRPRFLPTSIWVSKQVRREMIPAFIRVTTFRCCSIADNRYLRKFLDAVHEGGRRHVRNLRFDFFDCFQTGLPVNQDLVLAISCHGLRHLQLRFHWSKLHHSVEHIVERYHLQQLTSCKSLEYFTILKKSRFRDGEHNTVEELLAWVEQQFRSQGQEIICQTFGG